VAKCHDATKVFHYFQFKDEFSYLPQFFEKCEAKNLTIPLDAAKTTPGVKWAIFFLNKLRKVLLFKSSQVEDN
jgi:hypothetical protein